MDGVYKSSMRTWISDHIKVGDFLNQAPEEPITSCLDPKWSLQERLEELMPGEIECEEVENNCWIDNMVCGLQSQIEISRDFEIPEEVVGLNTLQAQKEEVDKRNRLPSYAMMVNNDKKYMIYPENKPLIKKKPDEISSDLIELPEVLLTVQIYHPLKSVDPSQVAKPMVDQEFFVIGHEFLTQLRDQIVCPYDQIVPGDFSENLDRPGSKPCKDLYKSGFFCIDGCFYNDMRFPDCKDYSKVIIDWAQVRAKGLGPFTTKLMEETQFIDLTIQLGYPYLYQHLGQCEHILIFGDIRLMDKDDCLDRQSYPMISRYIPKRRTVCVVCQALNACWVVMKDKRLPETTNLFCDPCLRHFRYDENGKKIGEFKVLKYCDRSTVV